MMLYKKIYGQGMSPITCSPNVTLHVYLLKGMKNEQTDDP